MKRKTKNILIGGCITLSLAVVILVTFIIGQNTGQKAVLAEAFVDKVSDQVTDQMDDDVTGQIAEKVLSEKIGDYVSTAMVERAVSENIKDSLPEVTKKELVKQVTKQVTQNVKQTVEKAVAAEGSYSMDSLSEGQRSEVKGMIKSAVKGAVGNTDVSKISNDDVAAIQNTVEKNIQSSLQNTITKYIKGNDVTLSPQTIEQITKQLNVTKTVKDVLKNTDTVVKEKELTKIQNDIIKQVEKNVKTPVKGTDYFTSAEISEIESSSAKKAAESVASDIKGVKDSVNSVNSNINSMQSQITSLSSQIKDSQKESSSNLDNKMATVQQSVTNINEQIKQINQNADDLGGKINVKNAFLRRITAKKGSIDKAEVVDTSDMTIAQFVGVLSGNEKEYTKAINQLSYAVTQIENIIGENFKSLSDECASLSQTIDANGDNITTLQEALNAESQKRESAITDIKGSIADNMSDVQEKLDAYKKASQAYADDQSESNRTALEDAKQALQDSLNVYKGNLDSLSDTVDGLDNATKKKVADINQQIADALDALNAGDSLLDEKITQLSGSTISLTDALQKAIDKEIQDRKDQIDQTKKELGDSINDQIKNVNDKMSKVEAAQKKYTDDASAENKQALAQAKTDLQAAIDQLNQTLSGDISSLDADTQQKITNVKATIKTLDDQLKQDGTDITTLKNGVVGLTTNLSSVTKSIDKEIQDRKDQINQTKKELGDSINDQIKNVNDKMSKVEAAQKKYTDDASAENKQALTQAKTDLHAAIDQLNQTLSGDISSLDADTQQKITNVKATIKTLDDQLKKDGTDITTLKNGVAGLTTNLSNVTKAIDKETTARQNADNAIKKTMGDSSDAVDVKGGTIFAKIFTLWQKITEVSKKVNDTDQWADGIVLANSTGRNSGKTVRYENVTGGTHAGGIRWKIDGNLVGLTNIKSTSNITIQYGASTPDIVCSYEQGSGYLYIYVDADYKAAALARNITIDSIHVESEQ